MEIAAMEGPDPIADRIDALEARLAYQDETIETLNQTVTQQWAAIDRLRRELERLSDRMDEAADGPVPVDRPPHY